jgi:molybdopterin molybdotransferase
MIESHEAIKIINATQLRLSVVDIPISETVGRILREDIFADTDFPPFNRVMMDGIAVKWDDFDRGIREYEIKGIQAAGSAQMSLEEKGTCLEVMTGAVAPGGADVVIPYEDIDIDKAKQKAKVNLEQIAKGKNIHFKGTDKRAGELLIQEGIELGTPEIAIAASVGKKSLKVTQNPTIAIVSTGNELVDIDTEPLPHQVRKSNVYALEAELKKLGIDSQLFHLSDDKASMLKKLADILDQNQVILMSGGVSKGKYDFVPQVLEELGVEKKFHRIRQKPGKPLIFGVKKDQNFVFAFPGNPVSTFMCFHKYFLPWLNLSLGLKKNHEYRATLAEDISIRTGLTYFLQVRASTTDDGRMLAHPIMGRGSGDHANLLRSNAFLELPSETYEFKKGEIFNLIPFRNL